MIGIDLGTTYSCMAYYNGQSVEIIPNDNGDRTTKSTVSIDVEERRVGCDNGLYDIKRIIGNKYKDCPTNLNYKLINKNGMPYISVDDKEFLPEEISAMVLSKLKVNAESYLGRPVTKAVITVPAYFNDAQRQATKRAGQIAGLEVLRIINEPTAAAVAYGLEKRNNKNKTKNILIFDLGGGTFDVTILNLEDSLFTVKATAGNTRLGGEDFDERIISHMISKHNLPQSAGYKLRRVAERAKRALSVTSQTDLEHEGLNFSSTLSRAKFEDICSDLFKKTITCVERCLNDSKLKKRDIDDVVIIGGSTRIPKVRAMLEEFFDGKKLNKSINPDEAVAYGAAICAYNLGGGTKKTDLLLVDVCPLSIGVETSGNVMDVIIKRNTTIPTSKVKSFTTFEDNQTSVDIDIYEGERAKTTDCHKLGHFKLEGITPKKAGEVIIDVTVDIDANSIVTISASEKTSGVSRSITVNNSDQLAPKEIERMVRQAEEYANHDRRIRERLEYRNDLEQACLQRPSNDTTAFEILEWLCENPNASVDEYKSKLDLLDE